MDDVLLILGPIHKENFDSDAEHARLVRLKQKTILGAELYQQAVEETAAELARTNLDEADLPLDASDPALRGESRVEGLISSIVRNCLIEIHRVHVRYEDGESAPERSLALGLTLSSLSVRSSASEEHYTSVFQDFATKLAKEIAQIVEDKESISKENPAVAAHNFAKLIANNLSTIFKTVRVDNLAVYFNSRDVLFLPKRTTQEQLTVQQSMPETHMSAPIPIKIGTETTPADVEGSSKITTVDGETRLKPSSTTAPHVSESSIERIIRNMTSMIAKHDDEESRRRNGLQYLIKPVSVEVMVKTHARVAKQPVYSEPNLQFIVTLQGPITDSKAEKREVLNSGDLSKTMDLSSQSNDATPEKLPSIQVELDQDQLASFGMMSATLSALAVKRKFAQFRPRVSATENPRAWWLFLRESLFHDIQKERKKRSLAYIDERRKMRLRYIALYREKLLTTWGFTYDPILKPSLTTSYIDHQPTLAEMKLLQPFTNSATFIDYQLLSLEDRIDADDVIFFRACARAQIDSEGLVKPENPTPTNPGVSSRSLWSRVAPWFGSTGASSDNATKANSDPSKLRNSLSKYHFSRLESSEPLQHDEPWVANLRLAIESSDPNAAWSSSLHSEHAHKIAPKYRHVHPDYAQTSGHISLPSIQLTLMKLEDPVVRKEDVKNEEFGDEPVNPENRPKDAAPVSVRPPSFIPHQYTLMGPQFTITHTERRPLGRLELLGIQVGFEVKPTHKSTSLRVALASISFADLTAKTKGGAQLVKFNTSDEITSPTSGTVSPSNLLDLAVELNPYHTKTGCRFTFDTFVAAKLRRLILLPNLDFLSLLAKNFSKSTSNSLDNIMEASKTLEKLKKVTRRNNVSRPTRSSLANALLVNASIDLPLIALTTHSTRAFDEEEEKGDAFPTARLKAPPSVSSLRSDSTPILVADLGSITVKSYLSFPHEPSLSNPLTPFGAVPMHLRERWTNSLLVSWEGLSAAIGDVPFKSGKTGKSATNLSDAINALISSFPANYSLDELSKLNLLHSSFKYCPREMPLEATTTKTRYLIVPMMPTRAVVKITSSPLLFIKEAKLALQKPRQAQSTPSSPNVEGSHAPSSELSSPPSTATPAASSDDSVLQQLASSLSLSKGLAKTEINATVARISVQVEPSSVSLLLRLANEIKPSRLPSSSDRQTVIAVDTKVTPLVVHDGSVKLPNGRRPGVDYRAPNGYKISTPAADSSKASVDWDDEDVIDELVAHQVAPNVQAFMFGSSDVRDSRHSKRLSSSSSLNSSSSVPAPLISSTSDLEYDDAQGSEFDQDVDMDSMPHFVPQIVVSPHDSGNLPRIALSNPSKTPESVPKKSSGAKRGTKIRRWMASNVSLKLLVRGVSVLLFAKSTTAASETFHSSLGISLLDVRASIASQADLKNEIKASIGSLLVYHPHSAETSKHTTTTFPFAATVPEGHFYASGWERKWASQQKDPHTDEPASAEKEWLSACYGEGRKMSTDGKSFEEDEVLVSRHLAPLISFGACVYGLPSNLFFEDGAADPQSKEHNNRSFWKKSSFCASDASYTANGSERLLSLTIDVDNGDAIRPVTAIKAHLGPLVLCPSLSSLTQVASEALPAYLGALKLASGSSTSSSSGKEKSTLNPESEKAKKPKTGDAHSWLEASPALHVGATWTGLALIVPRPRTSTKSSSSAPLAVLSVSRFRMSMDSVSKNKDMQLSASVGSLDLEIDENVNIPHRVYPFPLPRSVISVRTFMQPKLNTKLPFVKGADRASGASSSAHSASSSSSASFSSPSKFGPAMDAKSFFLSLRLVSRAHSVKEAQRRQSIAKQQASSLRSASDAAQLQQEAQESKGASNLAREGPWQRKVSAKLSRLSIVASPSLAWKLLEAYREAMPIVDELKKLVPKKDEKATSKPKPKTDAPAPAKDATAAPKAGKQLFSVPKLNVRLELPELLIPLSELSPFEHVSSTHPVHPMLRHGVGRGVLLQLGTVNATDGYSSGESNFNAPEASLSSSSASTSEKPEGKSFDLHYMITWRGINASLSYTVFEISSGILKRILPLSRLESPYALDYRLMDAILAQQTPIIIHVAQKNVFHSGPKGLDIPALHDDSLPEFVINSIKMRVEIRVGQLRIHVADHVVHALSTIFQERIEGYIDHLKIEAESLKPVKALIHDLESNKAAKSENDSYAKIASSQSPLDNSKVKSSKAASTPIFLSIRALLISVELYQSIYEGRNPATPLSSATASNFVAPNHLYSNIKDVVASVNTATNPRPSAIVKIGSIALADVAAVFCKFADQHDTQAQHTLIDVHLGALNVLLAAHHSFSESVRKSISSVQSTYISHCLSRSSRHDGHDTHHTAAGAPQGQKGLTSSAKSADSLFSDSETLYGSLPNLSSLIAWSSYTVPGQFPGYVPEPSGIHGTTFLEKAIVLSPPMVQVLGQRSLIYSNEYAHETPSYPLVKVHFLTTEKSNFVLNPNSGSLSSSDDLSTPEDLQEGDIDPIIDPSIASSSLAWVHPNINSSDPLSDDSSLGSSQDSSEQQAPFEPSVHSEKQITIEADHLLALANFESLAYLLQYVDKSIIPSIPKPQSKSKAASKASAKASKSAAVSASATSQIKQTAHTRIIARLSLLSVQIPATSRLPVESKVESRLMASRSDPPRSVVPSIVLEFGVDAELSLLELNKSNNGLKKKPSIKTSALLHSLQLYRTAYGQSSAATGASSAVPRAVTDPFLSPSFVPPSAGTQSSKISAMSMDHVLKSPVMQSTPKQTQGKPSGAKSSSYSLSFADIGRLFTQTESNFAGSRNADLGTEPTKQWPPNAPGLFGWRSAQAQSSAAPTSSAFPSSTLTGHPVIDPNKPGGVFNASQPHLSRLSKVPLLDPVSISASATILPGGSMDVSVLAEPLFLKVSNRDALAFLAILKSALGSPLLAALNQLKANLASKLATSAAAATKEEKLGDAPAPSPGATVHTKSSFFKVSLAGIHLLVLEDNAKGSVGVGAETPILNVQLQSVLAEIHMSAKLAEMASDPRVPLQKLRWRDEICAIVSMELKSSYFDSRGAFWETLIDPWRIDLHAEKDDVREVVEDDSAALSSLPLSKQPLRVVGAISSDLDVWVRAEERIEVTVTAEFLKILQKSKLRWNLSEWRLALESYSPYTKDAHAGAQRSLDFDARKNKRRNAGEVADLASDLDTQSQASTADRSSPFINSLLSKPFSSISGTLTPHSLLSSALSRSVGGFGDRGVSHPRTPGGLSSQFSLGVTPSQQVVLVNKTGLPLSFSLTHPFSMNAAASSGNGGAGDKQLDLGANAQVLSIDSQTTLDTDDLALLSLQFGTYNAVSGVPIFETAVPLSSITANQPAANSHLSAQFDGSSVAPSLAPSLSLSPITGVRFFQITRTLTRESSDAASSLPSSSMDNDKSSSFSQSHILVVEYSTIDLSTFITVRGTATFVNDCRSKNVRVGHAKLKSIHEHHLLPAGASWPIPFQWLDEGILNDLLYAHHVAQVEKKLVKRGKRVSTWDSELEQVSTPPPSKSQLTIDFQTLTPPMLLSMFTAKGSGSGTASGTSTPPHSVRRRSDSSSSHKEAPYVTLPPPFSISVNYQTSNHEDHSRTTASSASRKFASPASNSETVGLGSRQMEEMARLLPDFGASSIPLSIHIRPSLVLENLLPVPIDVRVLDRETAKIVVQENGVPTSKAVEVFCDAMSHPLLLSIRVPPSAHWSDDYLINTNAVSRSWTGEKGPASTSSAAFIPRPDSPTMLGPRTLIHATSDESGDEALADSILVRDDFDPMKPLSLSSIAKTHVLLDYKRPQLFTLHLSLYAAFWIENKSALPLSFAFSDQADLSVSQQPVKSTIIEDDSKDTEEGDHDEDGDDIADTHSEGNTSKHAKFAPSISALLPFQTGHKHLGGIENAYSNVSDEQEAEVSTVVDTSLVRPLFASFVSPASQQTGLALFVHWIRRPPYKPSKTDPRFIQDDLEGRNRHWSGAIDLSAFLPASLLQRKPDATTLAAPIHIYIPYSQKMSIHLSITIERCTGVFYKSFKLSVAPRLFISNVSSPGIESVFSFYSNSDHHIAGEHSPSSAMGSPTPSTSSTAGDPEREIQVTMTSGTESTIPVYLLPTLDVRFEDLMVHARLRSTAIWKENPELEWTTPRLQTTSITLNGPQSHLVNLTSSDGIVRGMARLEVARVETSASSGTLSSYLLAVSTSSQFFDLSSLGQPLIGTNEVSESQAVDGDLSASSSLPSQSSLAFQLCPYWINNNTQYWIKVTQSKADSKTLKKSKSSPSPAEQNHSALHVAPNSSAPFTWDLPECSHTVDIHVWTAVGSMPSDALDKFGSSGSNAASRWLLAHKSVQMDSTLLQIPFTLDGLSEEGGKARCKLISHSDIASQKKSVGTWALSSKKAVLGVEILVEGPRRHLNLLNLSERDFFSLDQISSHPSGLPSSDPANMKLKPSVNVTAFLGGLGVSIVHSQKRVLNSYQPHKLYTTTSAVEDSAELLYLVIADISANVSISNSKGTDISAKIEAIQLDCPDHAKLNTPNAVILTTMLDDVADSNTGTTDESQYIADKESSALFLQVCLPPSASSPSATSTASSQGSKLKKTASSAHSNRDPASYTHIDFLSLQLRPITVCLDQSFVEILLNFANDSLIPSSASSAANIARLAKYKKTGIPANISSQFAEGLSGGLVSSSIAVNRGVYLDASQLTYGLTSTVAEITPKTVLSSATLAMASTDATRILSSGLAFYKKPMFIGDLVIRPLTLRLTLTTSASVSGTHRQTGYDSTRSSLFDTLNVNRIIRAIGVGTVGVDGLKLRFGSNGVSRALVTPKELTRMIGKTYLPRAALQVLKVFGTLNFTGSPLILVENLAEGMMDVFVDPLHTQSGHGGYFSGAVHGAQNLVIKSIFGLSTSASNASASAAKLLSVLVDSSSSSSAYHQSSPYGTLSAKSSLNTGHSGDKYSGANGHSSSHRTSLSSSSELSYSDHDFNADRKLSWNSIWNEDEGGNDDSDENQKSTLLPNALHASASRPDITYSSSSSIISNALGGYISTSNGSTGTSTSSESLLANSMVTLGKSLFGGATGLVMDPIRGWRRNGASGAIRGLARGVANLALKPGLAVAQIIQGTADHLRMPAQRPPPSLLRAPRIPKLALSVNASGHTQSTNLGSSLMEDTYATSIMSIMGYYGSTVQASVANAFNGFPSNSSLADGSINSSGSGQQSMASSSVLGSSSSDTSSVTASVLSYLLASSTTSPSRHWDCYDGKSSIGYWILSKVSREKYNSEFSYRSRYGHVSPLGSYVNHWFMAAIGDSACDAYYVLTTRCFIKVVPSSSGVPFDASKNRIRQISLLSLSPLDIRYVILLSDVAAASFERPPAVGVPLGLGGSSMSSPRRPQPFSRINNDPHRGRSTRSSLDLDRDEHSHFVYILLNRPYATSIDANGTELSQFAEDDDEIPKKWFRKVKLASEFEAVQLLQLLPFSPHAPQQANR